MVPMLGERSVRWQEGGDLWDGPLFDWAEYGDEGGLPGRCHERVHGAWLE